MTSLVNLLVMDVMKNGKVKFADIDAKKSAATNAANDESNVDKEDNGESEVDEMKLPDYDRMNFNW